MTNRIYEDPLLLYQNVIDVWHHRSRVPSHKQELKKVTSRLTCLATDEKNIKASKRGSVAGASVQGFSVPIICSSVDISGTEGYICFLCSNQ